MKKDKQAIAADAKSRAADLPRSAQHSLPQCSPVKSAFR